MTWKLNTVSLLVPLCFLLIGLTVTVLIDPYISQKHRRVMLIIIVLSVLLVIQNVWEDNLAAGPLQWGLRTTLAVCGYTIRPMFLVLFLYIVRPEKKYLGCWGLIVLNGLLHLTAFFSPLVFHIDEGNHYQGGPLHSIGYDIGLILLGYWLFQSFRNYRTSRKRDLLIPLLVALMILSSVFLDREVGLMEQPVTFLTFAIVISCILYYIWLHLQFVREHEDDLRAQQRIQIMMTQIQPHFLYNTLTTIQSLCRTDPDEAFNVTEKFGTYLRQNLDTLNQTSLIPIQKELEHTRVYAEIEAVRFPRIQIEYDIEDTCFSVPALTVQPLVENAIRHGVRIRQNGLVTVATRKGDACHEIMISDNGKGFDLKLLEQTEETHIGIRNVRERIETMCGGTLTVNSQLDKGTIITIRIPADRRDAAEKGE